MNREHLSRKHKPSSTAEDSKTSTSSTSCDGPRLREDAYEKLRCRKQDSLKTWTQIYEALFPNLKVPSPFVEHYDHPREPHKRSVQEFSQILCDGLNVVLESSQQGSPAALAEYLRHYIQSVEHRYIGYYQDNESDTSSMGLAESETAPSDQDCYDLIDRGHYFDSGISQGTVTSSSMPPTPLEPPMLDIWEFAPELFVPTTNEYNIESNSLDFVDSVDSSSSGINHTISQFTTNPDLSPLPLIHSRHQTIEFQFQNAETTQLRFPKAVEGVGSASLHQNIDDDKFAHFPELVPEIHTVYLGQLNQSFGNKCGTDVSFLSQAPLINYAHIA